MWVQGQNNVSEINKGEGNLNWIMCSTGGTWVSTFSLIKALLIHHQLEYFMSVRSSEHSMHAHVWSDLYAYFKDSLYCS